MGGIHLGPSGGQWLHLSLMFYMLYKITIEQMSFTVVAVVVTQLCLQRMPVAEAQTKMLSTMSL